MALSAQQRDALYAYVANLLTESVNDMRDACAVDALASDIASVTHKALGDVVEAWNRTACGAIFRLPVELLVQSFSWLDLTERAKVTAVSRYFRSVALQDPSLWAQIGLDQRTPRLTDTLALLLERSGRAPLDVHIYVQNEDVAALLAPHISRIRTLILDKTRDTSWITAPTQDISWIFEQPAPLLELVKVPPVRHLQTVLPIPPWAPLLRRLELPSTFLLPVSSSGQFDRVTYFSGWMTTDFAAASDTDASRLFDVFPSLKILQLSFTNRSTSVDNLPKAPVPRTLEEITLHDHGNGLNIPALLALWHGHPFRVVNLHSIYTPLAVQALEHMRSVASGPWHLDLRQTECELRTEHDAVYNVNYDRYAGFSDIRGFLGTLGSIVAPATVFLRQLTELFNMPSLRSVTLHGAFPGASEDWDPFDGRLCVPHLQALRLEPEHHAEEEWRVGELQHCSQYTEELFRRFTLEDGSQLPKISRLVFSEVARPYVGEEYWAWIYQRASSVYIEDELLWQVEMDT